VPNFLTENVNDPDLGWFHSRIFPYLRRNDGKFQIDQILRPTFTTNFRSVAYDKTDQRPAVYIGGDNSGLAVYIDGVSDATQTNLLVSGYDNGQGFGLVQGYNPWLHEAARLIDGAIHSMELLTNPFRITIFGYSAGGAIGTVILKRHPNLADRSYMRLVSYGSPRALSTFDIETVSSKRICRWMNDNDPIPLVPPRPEDSPLLFLTLSFITVARYSSYVHTQGGLSLAEDGTATGAFLPPLAAMSPLTSLQAWYVGETNTVNNPHWIGNYEDRLFRLKESMRPGERGPAPEGHREAPATATRRELTRGQIEVFGQVQHAASEQNKNQVVVKPVVLFKAVRAGRIWAVEFGGQLFTYSGNKKRARHLARAGNDFLRSLPKQAIVDPETLVQQFTSFLNAAVQPGGPVTPPIRIGL
jgi:pimeloyl-ACP methyl ester carboxylesterase